MAEMQCFQSSLFESAQVESWGHFPDIFLFLKKGENLGDPYVEQGVISCTQCFLHIGDEMQDYLGPTKGYFLLSCMCFAADVFLQ